jgi:hypothetical protein
MIVEPVGRSPNELVATLKRARLFGPVNAHGMLSPYEGDLSSCGFAAPSSR